MIVSKVTVLINFQYSNGHCLNHLLSNIHGYSNITLLTLIYDTTNTALLLFWFSYLIELPRDLQEEAIMALSFHLTNF